MYSLLSGGRSQQGWLCLLLCTIWVKTSFHCIFGAQDEALSLAGFGVYSFIKVISGLGILAMILRLRRYSDKDRDRFEKLAL